MCNQTTISQVLLGVNESLDLSQTKLRRTTTCSFVGHGVVVGVVPGELNAGDGQHASQLLEGGVLHGRVHALVLILQRIFGLLHMRDEFFREGCLHS